MKLDFARAQVLLKAFDFLTLFREELGWEPYRYNLNVVVNDETFPLEAVAQKRSFTALRCRGQIPPYAIRRKIDRQVAKSYHEHLIIYTDPAETTQVWQWVRRELGKPSASRESIFSRGQSGEPLLQKLEHLAFSLEEEPDLTILDVADGVRRGFDVERVTKRFYERFKDEHAAFLEFVGGIPEEGMKRWYVSVTLNRLMFVYFIQKKGFLDSDPDYLRRKLIESRKQGQDRFYTGFLSPLFFKGFAQKEHDPATLRLLGQVPYLNGGIFARHQIEELYGNKLQIPDEAFERLFAFFDEYHWHLDERPLRADNEINPDVLGYIFEKYINQKQMGAYYTKEDITEYIGKNTILPYLLDQVRAAQPNAFNAAAWPLLQADPERYIYPAVRHGGAPELPPEIEAGVHEVAKRGEWNKTAPAEYALPTEIWREVVARRQRYHEIRQQIEKGEVREINDLVTYNLDIRQFAQDMVTAIEAPELLRAFFKALGTIKVLDPTVGSGAFLFAALNILEPLYEACLERMQGFLDELDASGEKHRPEKLKDFREILGRVAQHPNQRYFILKSIIVHNLYGVDIMEEAVEICKLRLFLKLVAQVEDAEHIEPLPDIDFNVRAGNTLVGFASLEEVRQAFQTGEQGGVKMTKLFMMDEERSAVQRVENQAEDIARLFQRLQQQQTEVGGEVTPEDKQVLRQRLKVLDDELNQALARQYGIDPTDAPAYKQWVASHKPFHWFVEFYDIMKNGGFDVIIGNPPWVEYTKIKNSYLIRGYETEKSGNLHGICTERGLKLCSDAGFVSMIVQLPMASSVRMSSVRDFLTQNSDFLTIATFGDRPGKLFDGLEHSRSVIYIARRSVKTEHIKSLFVTRFQRWPSASRVFLFHTLESTEVRDIPIHSGIFPKLSSPIQEAILRKLKYHQPTQSLAALTSPRTKPTYIFYQEATEYWVKATVGLPYYAKDGVVGAPAHGRYLYCNQGEIANIIAAVLNSNLFFMYFATYSDCFHLSDNLASNFPVASSIVTDPRIRELGIKLMSDLKKNAEHKIIRTKDGLEITYGEFYGWKSKNIIDEIDCALAPHYLFTDKEMDFIVNYDIKYRMGGELDDSTDE